VWSEYNRQQWEKFVQCDASSADDGSALFSFERNGVRPALDPSPRDRCLWVGVPTGLFPYNLEPANDAHLPAMILAVHRCGYAMF
jgi:hypothetical protein